MKDRTGRDGQKREGPGRDGKRRDGSAGKAHGAPPRSGKPAIGKPGSGKAVAGKGASAKPQSARPRPMTRSASGQGDHGGAQRAPADFAGPSASSAEPKEAAGVAIPRRIWTGNKPAERVPVILETTADGSSAQAGYHLIDSGDGVKLEQYGPYRIVRPEAQALWPKALDDAIWERADAIFTGDTDEDGMGRWRFPGVPLGETWPMRLLDTEFLGRFTAFRHVGVFPEQLAHWRWVKAQIEAARAKGRARPVRVLNLFGYTGVASLIAANAGAEVTHVDASKKAIGWARENQALGRGDDLPIRWICDDAMKFIQREERRGSAYDIILTDPPKFGRGPNGEVWHLFDHLPAMLDLCRAILSPEAIGLVLTAYSIRASFYSIHELMRETMRGAGGRVESGELILREAGLSGDVPGRALSTSLFSRWIAHDE